MEITPPPADEPLEYVFQRVVRIAEWVDETGHLAGKHFDDCFILGPALLVTRETVIENCTFLVPDPVAIFWTIEEGRDWITGAILIEHCRFHGCRFANVGLAGTREEMASARREITAGG